MSDLIYKTLTTIRDDLAAGAVKPSETVEACLARIEATEPHIKALLSVQADEARALAAAMDKDGPAPDKPLWGVPVILKDVLTTRGVRTTCGSKMLDTFVPFYDAHAVGKLKEAGAVLIAKANMDEFAMGSSTENSAYGTTANPWDLTRVPGGSSGGSAAAVAACQAYASLGTDTGGSIRLPSAFCGTVGIKPTYGRVSRYGQVAYGSSLDQIGPITRSVEDCALVLRTIAGHDRRDSTSAPREVPDYPALIKERGDLQGLRLGMPEEYWGEGLDAEVEEACRAAVEMARSLGAELVPVSLPHTKYAVATYYIIATAEVSSNLARFDGVRFGYRDKDATALADMYAASRSKGLGDEAQRRIMLGTYVLSSGYYDAYYRKAAQVRRLIRQDFLDAFAACDLIVGPTCPTTAFTIGEKTADPLQMYLTDIFTISLNLSGLPGMSLPVGLGRDSRMPVGLQLFGRAFDETTILQTAALLERELPPLPRPAVVA